MSKSCRGRVLIINNDTFDEPTKHIYRAGSQLDVERIASLFHQLHFEVRCLSNLQAQASKAKLYTYSYGEYNFHTYLGS